MKRSYFLLVSARYGSLGGILSFMLLLIMFYIGRHPLLVSPLLDFRIFLFGIFIFFALKEFRDYYQGGVLYFWQAMIGSLVVVMLASIIGATALLIFGSVDKTFLSQYIAQVTEYLKTFPPEDIERIGKETYERNLASLPATNMSTLAITYFIQGLVIGFFISIILSVILRRQPKT